jgi:ethanolamine-phosphate cytidylyltransferase
MAESLPGNKKLKKEVRVWVDGCFDVTHFGHANFCRQAKSFGDYLIVGIHSDEEIKRVKAEPVMAENDRYRMVRAIKWVDEVVEDVPYTPSLETLDEHNCDICVHGDDLCTDRFGNDVYKAIKEAGKFRQCPRTHGVSSTNLIQRILDISGAPKQADRLASSPYTGMSPFLLSSHKIYEFCGSVRSVKPNDVVVYCPGLFDLFHVGHLDFLEKAASLGTFLIVGLYSDDVAYFCKGEDRPILNLQERLMTCLSLKCVDDVVIGAPYSLTEDLLDHFKVNIVVHGKTQVLVDKNGKDPFEVAKARNIFREIDSGSDMSSEKVIEKICQYK